MQTGYRFAFDGTILDAPVAANVEVGLDPVSIDATLSVGSFQVGPLLVDQTQIGIDFVSGKNIDFPKPVSRHLSEHNVQSAFRTPDHQLVPVCGQNPC